MTHPLDNPALSSLTGAHARFAERRGNVLRYQVDVCPFLAMPDEPDKSDWVDAARLVGSGGLLPLAGIRVPPPDGWEVVVIGEGVQMTGDSLEVAADPEAVPLGRADVAEMLDLTARAKPGPFLHAVADNPAIGLYEKLGFRHRRAAYFAAARVPQAQLPGKTS
jgi:GNAT superfamily N-acetyltransferase